MLQRILALIHKEFLALLKDPKSRVVLIVPPMIQLLVFGYAASFDVNHIRTAVFNEDGGGPAREFIARFEGAPTFDVITSYSIHYTKLYDPGRSVLHDRGPQPRAVGPRLDAETGRHARRRAMFAPMRPSPMIPICMRSPFAGLILGAALRPVRDPAGCAAR